MKPPYVRCFSLESDASQATLQSRLYQHAKKYFGQNDVGYGVESKQVCHLHWFSPCPASRDSK